jgi:hypothetical protein
MLFPKNKDLLQRIENLEEALYSQNDENDIINIKFSCIDRAIGALNREERIPEDHRILELAHQLYKFVTSDK